MSVFELSALPKLRRIGLVRVNQLTDEAIYALAERHATLERIHLSYCDQISVMAIHFLLLKLHKLTHLSLTGVPAFQQPELQQFCREPPKVSFFHTWSFFMLIAAQDFNTPQRQAFCVFSCKGVSQLRTYLTELFDRITEMNNTDDTEYEEDDFDAEAYQEDDTPEPEFLGETRDVGGYPRQDILINPTMITPRGFRIGPTAPGLQVPSHEFTFQLDQPTGATASHTDTRDGRQMGDISPSTNLHGAASRLNAQITASTPTLQHRLLHGHPQLIRSVADVLPVVESPISPPPSDVASNYSIGTNNSNGAGFFRVYHERPTMSVSPQGYGALTPDLNYAEIGHGRGAQSGPTDTGPTVRSSFVQGSTGMQHNLNPDRTPRQPTIAPPHVTQETHRNSSQGSSESEGFTDRNVRHNSSVAADKSWSYHEPILTSPTSRDLQASVQSALGVERRGRREQPESVQNAERRARSVKRSIRDTFHAAEHYASSLLFGRNSEDTQIEGSNSGSFMASGSRSHPS